MKKYVFSLSLVAAFFLFFVAQVSAIPSQEEPGTISVRGEVMLSVPADRLNLDIGVTATARQAEQAMAEANQHLKGIITALEKVGLSNKEYQTRRFEVRPQWSSRPKSSVGEWRPEIVGFTVSTSLSIRTLKLELAGKLIAEAVDAGANEIGSLYFDLDESRKYRDQAIQEAVAKARADAETMAQASEVKILRILSLDLDNAKPAPVRVNYERGMALKAMAAEAPAIVAGDVSVRATVTMVCEIEQKK